MTNEYRAVQAIRDAEAQHEQHPWSLIVLLTKAIVYALLSISVAIEGLNREA